MLKNKQKYVFGLIIVLGIIISKQKINAPEDNFLSSGGSIIGNQMAKIDNYINVGKYLWNKKFSFLEKIEILQGEDEYPQGLCFTEEYILISSYSDIHGEPGKIRVFDKHTGQHLISLGLDEKSHVGGIAYDGTYIWICNASKMAVERISYRFIKEMIYEQNGQLIDIRNLIERYPVKNIPSCITCYDGKIWIATHSIWSNSTMIAYRFDEEKKQLNTVTSYRIPAKVQGIAFTEQGEIYISISYGRKNASYIKKYESIYALSSNLYKFEEVIKLPPCSEEIVYKNKKLYILFESAGKKYLFGTDGKGRSSNPVNKILVIEE